MAKRKKGRRRFLEDYDAAATRIQNYVKFSMYEFV